MSEPAHANGPLKGIRILDIAEGIAGPFCSKLLGDLGAEVVKLEKPAGDESRRLGPFPDDNPNPEASASYFFFNTIRF